MPEDVPFLKVIEQLESILATPRFVRAEARAKLLRYLVERSASGKEPSERDIAVRVFGRRESWDETDRFVSVYLIRLKEDLDKYYAGEGSSAPVRIWIIGRGIKAEFREALIVAPDAPEVFGTDFVSARDAFFTLSGETHPRCVVTGEGAEVRWHPLDGDPYNLALGNQVPLCARLHSHLDALVRGKKRILLPELDPERLGGKLAPRHYREWNVAAAYGCAALAFYLGEPPYFEESPDQRALRLCDVLHYARHHFFEPLIHHVIQHIIVPFLFGRIDALDPVAAIRLTIQFTALLEEAGYYDDAERSLAFALHARAKADPSSIGSIESFTLPRRRAQLLAERVPEDARFHGLIDRAQEQTGDIANRKLTLQVVRVHRWLRIGSRESLEDAYETLAPLTESYHRSVFRNDRVVIDETVGAADLCEIFLLSAIAACRLRPEGWKRFAEETVASSRTLMRVGGHVLPSEYAKFLAGATAKNDATATRMLRRLAAEVRTPLREHARVNVAAILRCLARMRLVT